MREKTISFRPCSPVEGTAQLAGYRGVPLGWKAATLGQGLGAVHAGPETTVGKAVVRFGAAEVVGKLALGDVADDADMCRGGLERAMAIGGAEVAAVPGTAEERGELAGLAAEHVEDGGELL